MAQRAKRSSPRRAGREIPKNPEAAADTDPPLRSAWKRYSYAWITLGLFLFSLVGHWIFGWYAYLDEQRALAQPVNVSGYTVEMMRDTLENWQSEFLQLLWQVGGLALFLYVGSPQSKEGDDRIEAKIDALLRKVDPNGGEREIRELDALYAGRHTDAGQHGHGQRRR